MRTDWAIGLHDLEFQRIPVECRSLRGTPFTRWMRIGMPKISERLLDVSFFLYANVEDAKAGRNPGGTGFIAVTYPAPFVNCYYAITNWHVAVRDGFCVLRLKMIDGGTDIIELGPEDWEFIPGGNDIAIAPINLDYEAHKFASIKIIDFWNEGNPDKIGVGDDVFMVGLFIDHAGLATNVPSARFGNISMHADKNALIKQPTGFLGESFVIDMHSRTGFSGSPVFAYRTLGADLTEAGAHPVSFQLKRPQHMDAETEWREGRLHTVYVFKFLGIHWGQFPETWELRKREEIEEGRRSGLILEGAYVEGMSGMTCVIPASKVLEVLNLPQIKKHEQEAARRRAVERGTVPKAESVPPSSDANPNHREDFNPLLGVAVKKPAQED